ncbi:hypothetical protein [Venatoribacter cucullus]|uniref:hypothetical protein n=1 Tax=Venatoribacter cucullus TaxID=2661630 RepID=UPI003B972BE3
MTSTRGQLKQIATEQIRRHTLHAASFREMGKALTRPTAGCAARTSASTIPLWTKKP